MNDKKDKNDKSQGRGSDKGFGHGKPDHEKGGGKSDYRDKVREQRSEQASGGGEFQQMNRANRDEGAEISDYRGTASANQDGNFSDYRNQAEADRLAAEANKKAGCLPKLFMLVVPFLAFGTYLVVRS